MCVCVAENISPEEEYKIACLLMVFVAVSMPTLASNVMSQYSPAIEGSHGNRHGRGNRNGNVSGWVLMLRF